MHSNDQHQKRFENMRPLPARVIAGHQTPDWTLEKLMEKYALPAVSAAVVRDMEILAAPTWGKLEAGGPGQITPDTLFQCASISKSVAAVGALVLVKEDVLALDEDIAPYLGTWLLPRQGFQGDVTLRRLLSHSAGVSVQGFEGYSAEGPFPTLQQMLNGEPPANSPAVELTLSPGQQFRYSGGGYLVIQKMMEEALGKPFSVIMRERVFKPLGMENSHYAPIKPRLSPRATSGHTIAGQAVPGKGPVHVESAPGGLWTTPADLARLMIEIMRAFRGQHPRVLSPMLGREMLEQHFWSFGLGVRVEGEGAVLRFNHGGATRGWHGQMMAYPERGEAIAVLTNGGYGYFVWPLVERALACKLGWPGWKPEELEIYPMKAQELASYTGIFRGEYEITLRESGPGIELVLDRPLLTGIPNGQDRFELLEMEGQLLFERDGNGKIDRLVFWFGQPGWSPYRKWSFKKVDP